MNDLKTRVDVAAGRRPADVVLKGGHIVNVLSGEIHDGDVALAGDRIAGIGEYRGRETVELGGQYVCPGFIDGHVHIESSMLSVPEFAKLVVTHGTVAVVTDPHEIANVMGSEGIRFMLSSSKYCPIFVYVMASSCVPASRFESAGAELTALDIQPLLADRWVLGLAEMMDYHGVVAGNTDCLEKLAVAAERVIDGHAPGLSGAELCAYAACNIGSDHECTTAEEAREKLRLGLHIMIREGSQARDLDALLPLVVPENHDRFFFVTDDKQVDDLLAEGHIDYMVRRAIAGGLNPVHAIKLASYNAARYFRLEGLGAVAPGKLASLAVLEDLKDCRVTRVYHAGRLVALDGAAIDRDAGKRKPQILRSSINVQWLEPGQFAVRAKAGSGETCAVHVIEVSDGSLVTGRAIERLSVRAGQVLPDPRRDIAKVAVIERHQASGKIGLGFVRGFGLAGGALASSVGHDSHNLVVVGTCDEDIFTAAVHVVKIRGGLCVVRNGEVLAEVPLPIGGLMSTADPLTLSEQMRRARAAAAKLEVGLRKPFMALSFLSLSVIGALKVTDQGLVDVERFKLIDVVAE